MSAVLLLALPLASGYRATPFARPCIRPVASPASRRCAVVANMDGPHEEFNWNDRDQNMLNEYIAMKAMAGERKETWEKLQKVGRAHVLVFNVGQPDEGVYTLQGKVASTHAAAYVLAFERTSDAEAFAKNLQGEGFDLATPMCWEFEQLAQFCDMGQFEVSLVPEVRAPLLLPANTPPTHGLDAARPSPPSLTHTLSPLCARRAPSSRRPPRTSTTRMPSTASPRTTAQSPRVPRRAVRRWTPSDRTHMRHSARRSSASSTQTARMAQGRWEGRGRWAAWAAASRVMVPMTRTAPRPLAARA